MTIIDESLNFYDKLKNTTSFSERLKLLMTVKQISGKDIANSIGVSKSTISTFLTGRTTKIYASIIFDLAHVLEVDPEWLLTGKGSPVVKNLNLEIIDDSNNLEFNNLKTSLNAYGYDMVESRAYCDREFSILSQKFLKECHTVANKCCLYTVSGDEMNPIIRDGDSVLVDQSVELIISGKIYAISVDDSTVICRRVFKKITSTEIILRCENENFSEETFDPSFSPLKILGRVLAVQNRIIEN